MKTNPNNFLKASDIIDFNHPSIQVLAKRLSDNCNSDKAIAKNCFHYVRDEIKHAGDFKSQIGTCSASEVLEHKTGWCYAKAHLLAALLRANSIPTGFCYQRLHCNEYEDGSFCLHGLNAIYLKEFGWYRVDPRGNKEGVNAQFNPPLEQLAFLVGEGEFDLEMIHQEPLNCVITALKTNDTYEKMVGNFPDIQNL